MAGSWRGPVVAHKLVAKVAREAAAELYDLVMSNNDLRKAWKNSYPDMPEKELLLAFVRRNAPLCVPVARATLATMLNDPGLDISIKECIVEALRLDSSVPRDRRPPQVQILNPEKLGR